VHIIVQFPFSDTLYSVVPVVVTLT